MPYIKKEDRSSYDQTIDSLVENLFSKHKDLLEPVETSMAGDLNYIITTLMAKTMGKSKRYSSFNAQVGVLESAKLELYRRAVAPYEDKKVKENGDVY